MAGPLPMGEWARIQPMTGWRPAARITATNTSRRTLPAANAMAMTPATRATPIATPAPRGAGKKGRAGPAAGRGAGPPAAPGVNRRRDDALRFLELRDGHLVGHIPDEGMPQRRCRSQRDRRLLRPRHRVIAVSHPQADGERRCGWIGGGG